MNADNVRKLLACNSKEDVMLALHILKEKSYAELKAHFPENIKLADGPLDKEGVWFDYNLCMGAWNNHTYYTSGSGTYWYFTNRAIIVRSADNRVGGVALANFDKII